MCVCVCVCVCVCTVRAELSGNAYTVAELSGKVHRDSCQKKIDMSVKLHFDRAVLKYTVSARDVSGKSTEFAASLHRYLHYYRTTLKLAYFLFEICV